MKHIDEIGVIVQARLSSQRCKRKMIRSFAGTTLLDIALTKLEKVNISNESVWCSVYEKELKNVCKKYPFNIFNRSEKSAQSEGDSITEIYEWWNKIPHKYIIMINACCPFVSVDTIERFIDDYRQIDQDGMFAVVDKRNYVWDNKGNLLTSIEGDSMNTKKTQVLHEGAHCLYGGSVEDIGKGIWMGDFSKKGKIKLWSMPEQEAFDIDYEWQFKCYESLYKQMIIDGGVNA